MISTNAAWVAKHGAMAKRPIYVVEIGGQSTMYATHDLAREGVTGTLPDYEPWLRTPQGAAQSVDVVNGTSTMGELMCEVVDQGGGFRTLAGATTLEGATLTLWAGYPGIAWTEFVAMCRFQLYKVTPAEGYATWKLQARDWQLLTKKTVTLHPENGERLTKDNPWYVGGSATEVMQAIVLLGLELGASTLDLASIAALESSAEGIYSASRPFLFALTEPFGAKSFLESEVYKPSGLRSVVTNTGQISLRCFRAPGAGAPIAAAFDEDNTVGLPVIDRLPVINEAIVRLDYDGDKYLAEEYFEQATSLTTFGRGQQWVVESKGLRSELGGRWFAQWVASRMFQRFAGTPAGLRGGAPTAKVTAFLATSPVWCGDYVTLSHPKMPDLLTGALGVSDRVYEVISRDPDYAAGRMSYTLLDTGLTGAAPARTWGASSARPLVIGTGKWY